MTTKNRCVIYSRVSTGNQDYQNQVIKLKEYASQTGWDVIDIIADVSSGSKPAAEREGLNKVFEMCHRKECDIVLFFSLDRLSREGSRKTIEYLTRLENYGIEFHSFTEPYLSSMGVFKDCIVSLLASLAKQEKIRIGERTRAGLERVRMNGTRLGRPVTPLDKIEQAVTLRKQGMSLSQIGKLMGVTPARVCQLVKISTRGLVPLSNHQQNQKG